MIELRQKGQKLLKLRYEISSRRPYSPNLKYERISCREDMCIQFRNDKYDKELCKSYFMKRIQKLENRQTKCTNLKEDYVEKIFFSENVVFVIFINYQTSLV